MRVTAIVQARMSSSRLPGKVLMEVAGKPLLLYLLDRLQRSERLNGIVVATSSDPSDDILVDFCRDVPVSCIRGPLEDVAGRFVLALVQNPADGFVRVCGDSPLLDHRLVDRAVGIFQGGKFDLVTNTLVRDHPDGQSVEVVRAETFLRIYQTLEDPGHFEHVTLYFYHHPERFVIHDIKAAHDYSGLNFVVDTPEDLQAFAGLLTKMDRPHWEYSLDDLVRLTTGQERRT